MRSGRHSRWERLHESRSAGHCQRGSDPHRMDRQLNRYHAVADMIEHLRRLIARFRASGEWPPLPPDPPEDPHVGVREPKWRRPSGDSAAVAVAEPEDERPPTLVAHSPR
jgi:hypothetical protein